MEKEAMEEALKAIQEVAENLLEEENIEKVRDSLILISSMCRHGGDLRSAKD